MTLVQRFLLACLGVAVLAMILGWAGMSFFPAGTGGAVLTGIVLTVLLMGLGLAAAGWQIMRGPLENLTRDIHGLAEGRLADHLSLQEGVLPGIREDLERVRQSFKFERGLARGVFQHLPMPYLLVDAKERTTATNQACLNMLEIDDTVQQCLGKTLAELFYNDPGRETAVGKSIRNGEYFHNLDVVIQGHRGGRVNVLANVFPIYDEEKTCLGGLCLYVDMSALKEAEQIIKNKNESLDNILNSLKNISREVSDIASKISESIEHSDHDISSSAQRLAAAAETIREMNGTVRDVAHNAFAASEASTGTREKAKTGSEVVERSLHRIQSVHQVSLELKEDMLQLNEHAQDINRIMGVISDIADQTNLLALNAAIEAARAGEAGRGFAVVADEVRKLAEKTMASTNDVGNAIRAIQESTVKSSDSVDKAVIQIEEATQLAGQSGQELQEIVSMAGSTAEQVNAIAVASEQQSAASEQINHSIELVSELASDSARSIAAVREEIGHLREMVAGMERILAQS